MNVSSVESIRERIGPEPKLDHKMQTHFFGWSSLLAEHHGR